jgi:TolB-like protein/tetratricopeptide (TPR) repeat protein
MGEESPKPANTPTGAVFLSYASQDAEAAQRICAALRSAGVEVWFDQSELRGGDAWDRQIRRQIRECTLFVPIISANSQARPEGYFRLEWDLADQRTHLMGRSRAFVVPVCTDATPEREADVPDSFVAVQWTRLPGGDTPPAFVERIRRLLSPELSPLSAVSSAAPGLREPVRATWRSKPVLLTLAAVFAALAYFLANKFWIAQHATPETAARAGAAPTAFNPPPHSIAVLPFVNLSGDKEQEYFSDGLTEELLNSLAQINDLQVAARTSSFYFKGKDVDLGTVAHRLNVGAVLEGSVRRSAHTIRITAQLINAVTGFHLWSKTYDRDLGDVLKLQTEIATSVASALKVTLLGDVAAKVELGGTRNPAAFDAYLRASRAVSRANDAAGYQEAIAALSEALRHDPNYALAFAERSLALTRYAEEGPPGDILDRAKSDALRAIALAPGLAEGHMALAQFYFSSLDLAHAIEEMERARALAPGEARILRLYGRIAGTIGRSDAGIAAARRAVALDPLNANAYFTLGGLFFTSRRYDEAIAAGQQGLALDPTRLSGIGLLGYAEYLLGNFERARSICEAKQQFWSAQMCLSFVYEKLGRHDAAAAMLAKVRSRFGDSGAYGYTEVYAQWGDIASALDWLEKAYRLHDNDLLNLRSDPLMDPLRKEPRFQAIERELKFPS